MKQITIFGATGFIGRHLVRRLAKTGRVICVPTRDLEQALILKPMGDVGQIVPVAFNPRDNASIAAAIGGAECVINLIGVLYEKGQQTFQALHVDLPARLAQIARAQKVSQFIQMSALGASLSSAASYARSKAAGEDAVRAAFPEASFVRPSIVFGPEDHFFNRFAGMARLSPLLPLIAGGTTRFQPVYVGDVAEAITRLLDVPQAAGKVFELAGPDIFTFRALLELMLRTIKRRRGFINLPLGVAQLQAYFMEFLPVPPLTRDQIKLLRSDNIMHPNARGLVSLGIVPTALELILPTYLQRFQPADTLPAKVIKAAT